MGFIFFQSPHMLRVNIFVWGRGCLNELGCFIHHLLSIFNVNNHFKVFWGEKEFGFRRTILRACVCLFCVSVFVGVSDCVWECLYAFLWARTVTFAKKLHSLNPATWHKRDFVLFVKLCAVQSCVQLFRWKGYQNVEGKYPTRIYDWIWHSISVI